MKSFRPVFHALLLMCGISSALAAPPIETLYTGNNSPAVEGWIEHGSGQQIQHDGTTEFITENIVQLPGYPLSSETYLFKYDTRAIDYIASIRLKVISSSYNSYDAGITFSPFGNEPLGFNARANNFMIGDGSIAWGDMMGDVVYVDTTVFHDYALRDNNGKVELFIDASFADIASGAASPVLSRTIEFAPEEIHTGHLIWGDATNDGNFNSHYIVDNIQFQNFGPLVPVPEPSTFLMMGAGLAGIAARLRWRARLRG